MKKRMVIYFAVIAALMFSFSFLGCATMGVKEAKPTKIYASSIEKGAVTVIDANTYKVLATVPVGKSPREMVLSKDKRLLFVAVTGGASVAVIDTESDKVVKNVKVGEKPRGLAISPDGKFIFVPNNGSGTVSIIDNVSLDVIKTVNTGKGTYDAWITPDGKVAIVPNNEENTISFIDIPSFNVTSVKTQAGPQFMGIMNNGKYAFVSNRKANIISVVDPAAKKVVKELKTAKGPFVPAFSADNRFVYVTLRDQPALAVIDTAIEGEFIISEVGKVGQPHDARTAPGRKEIYVTDSKGARVLILNGFTFEQEAEVKVGKVPGRLSFSADGKLAYVLVEEDGNLVIFETESKKIIQTIPVGKEPEGLVFK